MVVVQVVPENTPEVPLVQDDHVIQTFPPDRPDRPLDIWVLPGRAVRGQDLLDAQGGDPAVRGGPQISDSMLRWFPPFHSEDRTNGKTTPFLSRIQSPGRA